jgi:hypothetical protein
MPNRPRIGPVRSRGASFAPISVNGCSGMSSCGRGALVDGDVDAEVLHRRVEVLLHDGRQTVDLVDEQHVAAAELREDADEIGALGQRRPFVT